MSTFSLLCLFDVDVTVHVGSLPYSEETEPSGLLEVQPCCVFVNFLVALKVYLII